MRIVKKDSKVAKLALMRKKIHVYYLSRRLRRASILPKFYYRFVL